MIKTHNEIIKQEKNEYSVVGQATQNNSRKHRQSGVTGILNLKAYPYKNVVIGVPLYG